MAAVAIRLVRCSRARSVLIGLIAVAASAMLGVESSAAATVFNSTTTLTSNTTWSVAGSPYILNADVKVDFGVTLTINPGVVVKLNGTSRSMVIWGTMTAIGSAANPIVFTSLKDDSVGGDDGSDGPTVGTPGDWYNLQFSSGNALSYLQHVDVRFGSWGSPGNGAISLSRSAPYAPNPNQPTTVTVEDSSIHDGQQGGFYVYESNLVLRRSSVFGNGDGGIYASSGSVVADQNSITGNGARGVQILLGSSYQGAQSRLTRNTVTQNSRTGVHLFLDPGIPFANYPTGAGNNIFGNQTNQTGTAQMDIGAAPSGGAGQNPWAGNYWGPTAYWRANPVSCTGTSPFAPGYLADSAHPRTPAYMPPYGAVTDSVYLAGGSDFCSANKFPFGPFDQFTQPVDTCARSRETPQICSQEFPRVWVRRPAS